MLTLVCWSATTRIADDHGIWPSASTRTTCEPAARSATTSGVTPAALPSITTRAPDGVEWICKSPRTVVCSSPSAVMTPQPDGVSPRRRYRRGALLLNDRRIRTLVGNSDWRFAGGGASDAAGDTAAGAAETGSRLWQPGRREPETTMRHNAAPTTTPDPKDQSAFGIAAREARGAGTGVGRRGASGRLAGRTTTDLRGAGVVVAASLGDGRSATKSASGSISGGTPSCVPEEPVWSERRYVHCLRSGQYAFPAAPNQNRRFRHSHWTAGCKSQPARVLS